MRKVYVVIEGGCVQCVSAAAEEMIKHDLAEGIPFTLYGTKREY